MIKQHRTHPRVARRTIVGTMTMYHHVKCHTKPLPFFQLHNAETFERSRSRQVNYQEWEQPN
jgi:hypothetical protein